VQFDRLTFELGFDSEFERREVITAPRRRFRFGQVDERNRYEETVGMETGGSLFGERVMQFALDARWGVSQESFHESRPGPDLEDRDTGDLREYDFHLDFLPAGKISGSVFGSQVRDRIARRFLPSIVRQRERYGAELLYNDAKLPMRLTFEHLYDQLRSGTFRKLDDEDRREDSLEYEVTWQPNEFHSLRFNFEHERRKEQFSGTQTIFDTTRNYLTLDHSLQFGRDHKHRLETLLRYQDESGDLARDTFEFAPRLTFEIDDSLTLRSGAQYLREMFEQTRADQLRGDVGLTKNFSEAWIGSLDFYGLRRDTKELDARRGGVDETEWGGLGNLSFNKENRWGRLSANTSYSHTQTRSTSGQRGGVVINEAVTLRDPQPSYLAHRNIRRLTVIVTDAGRTRTYIAGCDYILLPVGQFTALVRLSTGRIADRQTVRVSYLYRTFNNYDLTRDRIDFRIQQEFKFGLTPYYAASIQNEDVGARRFRTFAQRNIRRHRVGATYRRKRWSAGLEYEYNDDSIDPYQALHVNGDWTIYEDAKQQLAGNGQFSRFLFDGSHRLRAHDTSLLDLGLSYRYLLARNLEIAASSAYRWEDESSFGRTKGFDLTGSLEYRIGQFSLLLETEYDLLDLPGSTDETMSVWLKLRRTIPVIAERGES